MRSHIPALLAIIRHPVRAYRERPRPRKWASALAFLQQAGTLTPGEVHALRAGDRLADLYAETFAADVIDADQLDEIAHRIRIGDLREAALLIGRLHPALGDLSDLVHRSVSRDRA